jgi:sulfonate transport system substrate-binding protein
VKLLEKHGLKYSDIQLVFLPPADARAAFERGSVDAWVIWDPFLAAAEKQINARLLADGKGVVNNHSFFLAERNYAEKNPALLKFLFDELSNQGKDIRKRYAETAQALSPIQGLDPAIIEQSLKRYTHDVRPITEAVLVEQQKIADSFHELKLIPKPVQVREAALPNLKTIAQN